MRGGGLPGGVGGLRGVIDADEPWFARCAVGCLHSTGQGISETDAGFVPAVWSTHRGTRGRVVQSAYATIKGASLDRRNARLTAAAGVDEEDRAIGD